MPCKRIVFHGEVQGVGFRHQTFELSRRYTVVGHVRNLMTGEVELVVQGDADEIAGLVSAIRARMLENIADVVEADHPAITATVFRMDRS